MIQIVQKKKPQAAIDRTKIYEIRQSGATLREIGEKFGITRERIRQILVSAYGSTHHNLISTSQLCLLTGLSGNRVMRLYEDGIITPTFCHYIGEQQRFVWSNLTVQLVKDYYNSKRICRTCKRPIPPNRRYYCSDRCQREKYIYRNLTPEKKQRELARQLLYREKKRLKNQ